METDYRNDPFGQIGLGKHSPDPYLEILLEVNLNFQERLTIILANGIFTPVEFTGKFAVVI